MSFSQPLPSGRVRPRRNPVLFPFDPLEPLEPRRLLAGGTGLRGDYFDSPELTGHLFSRHDAVVQFNWGEGGPAAGINGADFSARWSGQVQPAFTETYTFLVTADQGVRLWVNGRTLIDDWASPTASGERSASIALIAGRHYDLQLEFKDTAGGASVKLEWTAPGQPRQVIPAARLFPSERGAALRSSPAGAGLVTSLEAVAGGADASGQKLEGFVHAPLTGVYTFHVAGDGPADLYLSGTEDAAGQRLIASVPAATGPREWGRYAEQRSATIRLVAGQRYRIEARHRGTGAQLAVAWTLPDGRFEGPIAGPSLSPPLPQARLSLQEATAIEGAGLLATPATFVVTRTGGSTALPLTVNYAVSGTASNGADYAQLPGSVTIPAGATSATITIAPTDDASVEAARETVVLTLTDGAGYDLGPDSTQSATATIVDDDVAAGGVQLLPPDVLRTIYINGNQFAMSKRQVAVTGMPFTAALELSTFYRPAEPYLMQLFQATTAPVNQGDTLLLTFWARSLNADGAAGQVQAVFEKSSNPYSKSLTAGWQVRDRWQKIQVPFTSLGTFAAGGAQLCLQLGFDPQTIQIGGISLVNLGTSVAASALPRVEPSYRGRDLAADWRAPAEERIEQARKAPVTVAVRDAAGNPVDGALVHLRQADHDFAFGSAINGDTLFNDKSSNGDKYRALARRLFNRGTIENELKWREFEGNRQLGIDSARWVVDAGMSLRGHVLVWPRWLWVAASPGSTYKGISYRADPAKPDAQEEYEAHVAADGLEPARQWLRERILNHIADEAGAVRGLPLLWDVVNEPYANRELMNVLGDAVVADWFNAARAADPGATLVLNDYGLFENNDTDTPHLEDFDRWVNLLKSAGAPIESIGSQAHFQGWRLTDMDKLQSVIERFAATYGLPMEVTEFDVDTTDEQLGADYLRDAMTMAFSQPSMRGFTIWGFWEGRHYKPHAALYRMDFSRKPSAQAWEDLVYGDWWTDARGTTASDGQVSFSAFAGEYDVIVTLPDGSTSVSRASFDPATPATLAVTAGELAVTGSRMDDTIRVRLDATGTTLQVFHNAPTSGAPTYARPVDASLPAVQIAGGAGNDTLVIDLSNGNPLAAGLRFDGGTGSDAVRILGTAAGDALTIDGLAITTAADGRSMGHAGLEGLTLDGGAGDDSIHVTGAVPFAPTLVGGAGLDSIHLADGTFTYKADAGGGGGDVALRVSGGASVTFAAAQHLRSLTLDDAARASLAKGKLTLRTADVAVAPQASLDLSDGTLAVEPDGVVVPGALLGRLTAMVLAGHNGGTWDGVGGIVSAPARADSLTTLAVVGDPASLGSLTGASYSPHAVLVTFAAAGDTNLDGRVDAADYYRIDAGSALGRTGYANGDLNLDDAIDADDYLILDRAFVARRAQSALVAAETPEAVPAPAPAIPLPAAEDEEDDEVSEDVEGGDVLA